MVLVKETKKKKECEGGRKVVVKERNKKVEGKVGRWQ